MKALILCGGEGSRLWPITYSLPKQLIPLANKPILFYILEELSKLDIIDVGIVVTPCNKRVFEDTIKDNFKNNFNITYIVQQESNGLASAVLTAESFINGEVFLMVLGDTICEINYKRIINKFVSEQSNCQIVLNEVDNPERYGIATIKNDRVIDVVEKPKSPTTNLAIAGVYIFDNLIFQACRNIKPSWRKEYEITDAIKWLIKNSYKVTYHLFTGRYVDLGKPKDILDENKRRLENQPHKIIGYVDANCSVHGKVYISKNTKVINSTIIGPITIGDNCTIKDSLIGPYTVIGNDCTVENIKVKNTIILDRCSIRNTDLMYDSIIGADSRLEIENTSMVKKKYLLGNHSVISD